MLGIFDKKTKVKKEKKVAKTTETSVSKSSVNKLAGSLIEMVHISEKASRLASSENQYTFRVAPNANKNEIKKQIEAMFGVNVTKVRITVIHSKTRVFGRNMGVKAGYKKAIVSLKKGDSINSVNA